MQKKKIVRIFTEKVWKRRKAMVTHSLIHLSVYEKGKVLDRRSGRRTELREKKVSLHRR
jgi:hypothetical protein